MRGDGTDAGEMPRLDAFDDEFGREPVAMLRAHERRTRLRPLIGLLLAAAIVSVPALAWLSADGSRSPSEGADAQVERLVREIAGLKQEIKELTEAQQAASEQIASLQAAEQEARNASAPAHWYSDLTALSFESASPAKPAVVAPPAPRGATARPEAREIRRRDNGEPLSLEAPQ